MIIKEKLECKLSAWEWIWGDTEGVQLQVSYHAGYQLNLVKECTVRSVHSTQSNSMKAWVCVDNIKKNPAPSIPVSLSWSICECSQNRKTSENSRWTPQNLLPSLVGYAADCTLYSLVKGKRIVVCAEHTHTQGFRLLWLDLVSQGILQNVKNSFMNFVSASVTT